MTDRWVVDASVIAKLYLEDEDHTEVAEELVTLHSAATIELLAPQPILYEVPNAILAAARRERLGHDRALDFIRRFLALRLLILGDDETLGPMIEEASGVARDLGCALYDAMYVITAQSTGTQLITADAKPYRGLSRKVSDLVWIADYQAPDES